MVVKHNLQAMNANRMLGITTKSASGSTEKLSSGYKINRAADDAAGLAISEKMRKQVRGLTKASANAEDGVSAVQTAEGALAEVHDMLQRMNELCVQAANGTNSEADRGYIQDEIEQLETEIDRIAQTTKFNEIYLLNGNGQTEVQTLEAHDAGLKGTLVASGVGKSVFTAAPMKVGDTVKIGDQEYTIKDSDRADKFTSINSLYNQGNTTATPAVPDTSLKVGDKIVQDGVTYTVKTAGIPGADFVSDVAGTPGTVVTPLAEYVDDQGNEVVLTIKEGATLTRAADGKTTKLVGSKDIFLAEATQTYGVQASGPATNKNAANANGWKPGDKIVDEDGIEYIYVAAGGILNNVTHATVGFYKSEGNKAGDAPYEPKAGDTYTIKDANGNPVTDKISNGGIATIETIKNAIRAIEPTNSGATDTYIVRIQDSANDVPGKEYKISATTSQGLYTADDVANLVQAGNYVTILKANTNYANGAKEEQYYALPPESTERNNISVEKAYLLMADELKAASDIGADKGSESVVKNNGDGTFEITHAQVEVDSPLAFNLHVGADADLTNKVTIDIRTITTKGLGLQGLNVKDATGNGATYGLDAVTDALRIVSTQRSLLGAAQNRLEHTISNLDNIIENTTAAEANIRDTDMAEEMVSYANTQVLMQAGQSILAQANQANQGVLSLLQ